MCCPKYGENCERNCGRCNNNVSCRHDNGHCSSGCAAGWAAPKCDTECPAHTFGENCSNICGRCKDNVTCDRVSGLCPLHCSAGWSGPRCDKVCAQYTFGDNCSTTCGQCKDNATCHHIHGTCSLGCAAGRTGHRCDKVEEKAEEDDNNMMLIPAVGGSLLGLIIVFTIVAIIIMRRRSRQSAGVKGVLPAAEPRDNISLPENAYVMYRSTPPSPSDWTPPTAAEGEARWNRMIINILDKLQGRDLEKEFSELRFGKVFECTVAVRRRNRRKNRFKDILPYDHSRVVLENINGEDCSDYINASYIKGYNKDTVYIATQGPMQTTEDDFWRMVWQEHVTQIVMLTKSLTKSHKTAAFYKYWPSAGEKKKYDQVEVTCVDEVNKAHFIVRTFSVKQDNEYRHVEQFQFTGFTDQETPSAVSFVVFWRFVNSRAPPHLSSPSIIHCSAGVGLTGVYIALDIVMKQAESESETNIFDVVNRIRLDRCSMVKSKDYYLYLHRTVLEACVSRGTCLDMATFEMVFPELVEVDSPNNLIDRQFQNLRVLPDVRLDDSYAFLEESGDDSKKFLTVQIDGGSISINAFFVPTLLDAHGIIMTPLPESWDTVWSLVEGYSIKEIMLLGNALCGKPGAGPYWPTQTGHRLQAGPYTVSLTDKRQLATCLTGYSLTWQRRYGSGGVQLTHYNDWHEDIPVNTCDLVYLLKTFTTTLHERERTPLLVLCMSALHRDSVARSCLFCVMCHLLGQMTLDGQVDVFTAVRHMQSVVPDFVLTAEQFRLCFQTAQQLLTSDIYANTMAQ
ncbi:receptor-type tyrosine-protein phosphatase kappa-like isoform X1 [Pomacea canaliculata]|uniref:receptor-type tyrosine-protein phosphatase kappa-like isoform X1 n=1 Tax=Pomacea canaliculata TaxID=400727 RepID=UPI000D72E592|nr:receptor-type tyrosine-protein phosphatase kappa-like isoform X1 [Pomacea canaliculata]